MRLDEARIAIRERAWLDNLDLALHVIRAHAPAVFAAAVLGALPMIAINYFAIDFLFGAGLDENAGSNAALVAVFLVMTEAPLATAPLTLYLGQALFVDKPHGGQIARDFLARLPQLLLFQLVLRAALIVPVFTWFVPYGLWPYLNEVILLERNPLVGTPGTLSTAKRSRLLHRNSSGEYVARAIGAGLLSLLLVLALYASQQMLLSFLFGIQQGWTAQILALQVVLWTVASYFAVARFLMYLDQRIRSEGWEVELLLRAQREQLSRHPA